MSTITKTADVSAQAIWNVLADPHSYSRWVVGAKEVRGVSGDWPQPGARIHHTIGTGPLENKDDTVSLEAIAPSHLAMRAHFRPLGVARVIIDLTEHEGGTDIVMEEIMVDGAAAHLPQSVNDIGLHPRNVKTLDRLIELAKSTR